MNRFVKLLANFCGNKLVRDELYGAEANVESLLADINRKPAEQRLKALLEGAKEEGEDSSLRLDRHPDDEACRGFTKPLSFIEGA